MTSLNEACLVAQVEAEYGLPARIGDYTDFCTGIHHATTVGKLFRPDNPLLPAAMREAGQAAVRLTRGNAREAACWTAAQLVVHHSVGGCNLQPGDLFGSGSLSGPNPDQAGSMLELTLGGKQPITLPNGETRSFLADGDTLSLRGCCERAGARRIDFGTCVGTVLPAPAARG